MSTRERWIVYPLLFMTLGIALRDKIMPPAHLGNLGMQIEAGTVSINNWRASLPETPFGGVKDSGFGREGGSEGILAFTTIKHVSVM